MLDSADSKLKPNKLSDVDLNQDANALIIFVHIPKTAGTTIFSTLAQQYSADNIYLINTKQYGPAEAEKYYRRERLLNLLGISKSLILSPQVRRLKTAIKNRRSLRVIGGHIDLSIIGKILPQNSRFFTFLRDPVERAISHYYFYRKIAGNPLHAMAMRATLAEWVGTCALTEMDNGQTRRLAGQTNLPWGQVTRATLELAKSNLAKFAVVGLTERFEESQVVLHRAFDWPLCQYSSQNVSENRSSQAEIAQNVLRVVKDVNRFDIELYQFAVQLFDKVVSKLEMSKELNLLRMSPRYFDSCSKLKLETRVQLPTTAIVDSPAKMSANR